MQRLFDLANPAKSNFLAGAERSAFQKMLKAGLLCRHMTQSSKFLFGLISFTFILGIASCGQKMGENVSFLQWYLKEFKKGVEERTTRESENEIRNDRSRRFEVWRKSPEGRRAIAAQTEQVLVSPQGFSDTVYEMSGPNFKIASRSAGATLTGKIDHISAAAHAWLRRADGSTREFRQDSSANMLGYRGEGAFDEDDRLVAALLRDNPRPGWPGRALKKIHPKQQSVAAEMWQKITGEELWGYSSDWKGK
jgi:hypothetical protein